jgi:hypothetical protein
MLSAIQVFLNEFPIILNRIDQLLDGVFWGRELHITLTSSHQKTQHL